MSKKQAKRTSIGGQAVLEGVMMRGESSMATAVRDAEGVIRLETERITPAKKRNWFFRLPVVRGVYAFVQSLVGGTKVLMRSAEVYGESEPSKFEKWLAEKLKINIMSAVTVISLIIGFALAVFLFIFLPQAVRQLIERLCGEEFHFSILAKNFIEGGIKLLIFIGYLIFCSLIKDVKRTFMYHGAEHKTISCYEKGLELTVENAKKCPRVHDRCGTTFLVFVMVISILVFALVESLIGVNVERIYRVLLKIALLPVVAGLSYELLKALSKTNCFIFYPLKVPGLLLQRITTREPDDSMLEVAIKAFTTVMEMDGDKSIPARKFAVSVKMKDCLATLKDKLKKSGITEGAEAEWIMSVTLGVKRDELNGDKLISPEKIEKINKLADERITGRPLWYCVGDTDFFGYKIKVDERVLIPRPETELLVENALKYIDSSKSVLDLCTGSGAVAIVVKKKTDAAVTASDISGEAIELAKENATCNNADIEFIKSDLFCGLKGRKFDVILSNPPYIKSGDIISLQREIKDFEPRIALDGGDDGLDFYRSISENIKDFLNVGGVVLLECGIGQAGKIKDMLTGFSRIEIIKDYENIDRIVKAVL